MLKIFVLLPFLSFISISPAKKSIKEETGFCNGLKFVIGKIQNSKEFSTLKDTPKKDGEFDSKLKFSGWDFATVKDNSDGLNFTCFSKTADESEIKKLFIATRLELIECLKLGPDDADEDEADYFSVLYFPTDGGPSNSETLTFSLTFFPKDKKTESFITLSIQNSKD